MTIAFLHLRDTDNIGDRWCSPYDWFDWPDSAEVRDLRKPGAAYDIGVYGGGKIFGGLASNPGVVRKPGALHIAWGVGTLQNFPVSLKYARARAMCTLVGSRDRGDDRYAYSPCVSCMAPQFDDPPPPRHAVVFYAHAGKTERQGITVPSHYPIMSNTGSSHADALKFIASGETVVSNSYHGVYWALLMGRRVICLPFSRKFSAFHAAPHFSSPKRWESELNQGVMHPEMLTECRAAVWAFKQQVDGMIARHS